MRTLYLNNSGSRWVNYTNDGKKERLSFLTKGGWYVHRTVIFYESFGNYAVACISYKGKKIKVFPDAVLED